MLGDHPINVVLLATDLDATKDFYANKVGLKIINESPGALGFKCGGDSQFTVSKSSVGNKDDQTQAAFRVKDLRAEVVELKKRGVKIENYDRRSLMTDYGIDNIGIAWIAWINDP